MCNRTYNIDHLILVSITTINPPMRAAMRLQPQRHLTRCRRTRPHGAYVWRRVVYKIALPMPSTAHHSWGKQCALQRWLHRADWTRGDPCSTIHYTALCWHHLASVVVPDLCTQLLPTATRFLRLHLCTLRPSWIDINKIGGMVSIYMAMYKDMEQECTYQWLMVLRSLGHHIPAILIILNH